MQGTAKKKKSQFKMESMKSISRVFELVEAKVSSKISASLATWQLEELKVKAATHGEVHGTNVLTVRGTLKNLIELEVLICEYLSQIVGLEDAPKSTVSQYLQDRMEMEDQVVETKDSPMEVLPLIIDQHGQMPRRNVKLPLALREDYCMDERENEVEGKGSMRAAKQRYEERVSSRFLCHLCSFKTGRQSHLEKHLKLHLVSRNLNHNHGGDGHSALLLQRYPGFSQGSLKYERKEGYCGHSRHVHMGSLLEVEVGGGGEECEYVGKERRHLSRHEQTAHSENRSFLCSTCGKSFKRSDTLAQHIALHEGSIRCSECGKPCRSKQQLSEHKVTHHSTKMYLCEQCGKTFKRSTTRMRHLRQVHLHPGSHSCPICGMTFNSPFSLKRHKTSHEAKESMLSQALSTARNSSTGMGTHTIPGSLGCEEVGGGVEELRPTFESLVSYEQPARLFVLPC
ncbi:unnamed protein product [Darwinula stevensoni]|uniref:C2H2-type domain-containing protein n=1 Tax=Darwinula stevensoni TaxID=69355 RepID=A0A7R9A8V3_9CRUS|nr:unnamed protein product [Darwinula stevensoni]CAG0896776.1 unnamed protein product [Darwinula stevensoni]